MLKQMARFLRVALPALSAVLLLTHCAKRKIDDFVIAAPSIRQVQLTDSFWQPRIRQNSSVTIPAVMAKLRETGRIKNFTNAARVLSAKSESEEFCSAFPFDDSDVYKFLEAGSYALLNMKDKPEADALDAMLDSLIVTVSQAQEVDGYLYTARTMNPVNMPEMSGKERFINEQENSHELYNLGHLYEAACTHFEATGKRNLLNIAVRSADYLFTVFGNGRLVKYPGHEEIETGLARLYRTTGNPHYLELARIFLDNRGPGGLDYNQADIRPVDQTEAKGHAVRGMYLYSGMAEVGALRKDSSYLRPIFTIWDDVIKSKTYITGGVGSKASNEGFSDPYDLPNHTAYCETCSSIGFILWNERLFRLTGDGKYMDMLEKTLYNAFLSGLSLSGDHFFYPNPLEAWGRKVRPDWYACACCPPNVARVIPMVPRFFYGISGETLWINLYGSGTMDCELAGNQFRIIQQSGYPWSGAIQIAVSPEKPAAATVRLRIPGWARNQAFHSDLYSFTDNYANSFSVSINGQAAEATVLNGYVEIHRTWNPGDTILLNLPMPVRLVKANPAVKADAGKVAVQRGPVIYCAEGADNEGSVLTLIIDSTISFTDSHAQGDLANTLLSSHPVPARLIPYYSWANRAPGEMAVWFATDRKYITRFPEPPGLEAGAIGSASYAYDNSIPYLNDGIDPVNSADRGNNAFRLHPHKGTEEWVAYRFTQPQKLSAVKVYWLDDGSYGLPASWSLSYLKADGSWSPVDSFSPYLIEKDQYNEVTFVAVNTLGLRIDMKLSADLPGGIIEWKVK
jgi:DUF1680 family protein